MTDYPNDPLALISVILDRFHEGHRRDLPVIRANCQQAADAAGHRADWPADLARKLDRLADELEQHLLKEEMVLFPLMRAGGHPQIGGPIACMRHDHAHHEDHLDEIDQLTQALTPPANAPAAWTALYDGLRHLASELREHIRVENTILFPQFDGAVAVN